MTRKKEHIRMAKLHQPFPFLAFILTLVAAFTTSSAVDYLVTNQASRTPGGARFASEVGEEYAKEAVVEAITFTLNTYYSQDNNPKKIHRVNCYVDDTNNGAVTDGNMIHLSAEYVETYAGDLKKEMTGIIYHGMSLIFQWDGQGQAPEGLVNGMADYVRLKAGYAPTDGSWLKPGKGDSWDQGSGVTANFLLYCTQQDSDFVRNLNGLMQNGYNDNYFDQLLHKSVTRLFQDLLFEFFFILG